MCHGIFEIHTFLMLVPLRLATGNPYIFWYYCEYTSNSRPGGLLPGLLMLVACHSEIRVKV